jgi:hypothetical protein
MTSPPHEAADADTPTESDSGYRTQSRDTAEWADRMQFDHWRTMTPVEKFALVDALCEDARRLAQRHPDADPEELRLREACQRLGRETVERVLGRPLPFSA